LIKKPVILLKFNVRVIFLFDPAGIIGTTIVFMNMKKREKHNVKVPWFEMYRVGNVKQPAGANYLRLLTSRLFLLKKY